MHKEISVSDVFIDVISSGINQTPLDDTAKSVITEDIYEELYELGEKHHVTHIMADVLLKEVSIEDEDFKALLRTNIISSINKSEKIRTALKKLCDIFEQEHIPFVPLKGSVIRDWYPKDWYRSSSDIDVLVKDEDFSQAEKILTDKLGCKLYKKGPHDVSYLTENKVNIELHFVLMISDGDFVGKEYRRWNAYTLDSVWDRITPKDGYTYRSVLTNEDFYLFHVAHMAKHFENGGCGVRSIIDLYLMDNLNMYDENVEKALKEAGLLDFSNVIRAISKVWFGDGACDETTGLTGEFIINGGVFGNPENKAAFGKAAKGGKGYILSRIFMPYRLLKTVYPVLCKHKWLYPIYTVVRWIRCLSTDTQKRVLGELKSETDVRDVSQLIKKLGL